MGVGNDNNFINPGNVLSLVSCGMLLCFVQFTKKAGLSGPTRWSEEEIQIALEGSSAASV